MLKRQAVIRTARATTETQDFVVDIESCETVLNAECALKHGRNGEPVYVWNVFIMHERWVPHE